MDEQVKKNLEMLLTYLRLMESSMTVGGRMESPAADAYEDAADRLEVILSGLNKSKD